MKMNRKTKNIIWNIVENLMVLAVVFVLSMTIVMMIFGSYVFSIQNQASVFNRTGKSFIRAERLF